MNSHINVRTTVKVERICKNCLYCGTNGLHCGNANNHGKPMIFVNRGMACNYFWLDQHRFPDAESRW